MSGTTKTPNYNLLKPNVGADNDLWGDHLNTNSDTLDALIKTVENKAGVTTFNTRAGAVTLSNADVVTVLPPGNTAPAMNGTASAGLATTWSKSDHVHGTDTTRAAASSVPSPSAVAPTMNSVADAGVAVAYSRGDHTHPVDTSRYAASNPSGYQTAAQVTTALLPYALLASPPLTGSPTAPTVTPSTDSSTKIATTAFVQSALGAVPGGAVIAATPPALSPGALWWDSTGGQLYVRYDDGNTQQWVAADNLTGLANAATQNDVAMSQNNVGRNKLHNGLFTVAQRGAGPFTSVGTYSLDRWAISLSSDAVGFSQAALVDADRAAIGDEEAQSALQNVFTGNAAAGAYSQIVQKIENVRRLAGRTVIISFWAKAASGTPKLGINMQQVFGTGGSPSAGVWALVTGNSVTLSTAWTRYSTAIALPSISAKVLGTNGDHSTWLDIFYSSGSATNAIAGNIGVQSGTINLWGVQLEIAAPGQTQPSVLEKKDPRIELSDCQRFYQTGVAWAYYSNTAAGTIVGNTYTLPVTMRATPTCASLAGSSNTNIGPITFNGLGPVAVGGYGTATAAGTVNISNQFSASADL